MWSGSSTAAGSTVENMIAYPHRMGTRVWRAGLAMRIFVYADCVFAVLVGLLIVLGSGIPVVGRIMVAVGFAGGLFFFWWLTLRPRMIADDDGLLIIKDRQPERIPWTDIVDCTVQWGGTVIATSDGRLHRSRYPQRGWVLTLPPTRRKTDEAVAYLLTRAEQARTVDQH